jgi:hypothetical protein
VHVTTAVKWLLRQIRKLNINRRSVQITCYYSTLRSKFTVTNFCVNAALLCSRRLQCGSVGIFNGRELSVKSDVSNALLSKQYFMKVHQYLYSILGEPMYLHAGKRTSC